MKKTYFSPICKLLVINTRDILSSSPSEDLGWTKDY